LIALLRDQSQSARIDLETGEIALNHDRFSFDLNPAWRKKLINGWDDIDLTLGETNQIAAFAAHRKQNMPWVWPNQL